MRFIVLLIASLVLAGCASKPPAKLLPTPPPLPVSVPPRHVLAPKVSVGPIALPTIPWQYPPEISPNAYCWTLQISMDLVNWSDVPNCQSGVITVTDNLPWAFFRLKGTK